MIVSRFRRLAMTAVLGVVLAMFASSCGKSSSSKKTLYIYIWCDYLSEEVVQAFEEKYDCTVVQDIFDSNEMLEAKLKAGASDYDIVVPSSYVAGKMHAQGMIQTLDKERLAPTIKNLDAMVVKKFPEAALDYSIPYMMSYTGIAYLKSKVKDFEPSWKMFERSDLRKRMTLLDDYREVLGAALKSLGYSANSKNETELRAAAEKVLEWKANAAKFDNEQYKQGIASGEFYLVQGYVGDLLQVQEDNDDIEIVIPREGTQLSIDSLALPTGAKNVDLAYDFINFVHEPANAAKNTESVMYLCPNKPSYELLSPEIRKNGSIFPEEEIIVRSELLHDLGEAQPVYNRLWETIKGKDSLDD